MNPVLGGYHIKDIEFSAAIDINATKVGKDLSEAIWEKPNNTYKFSDVPFLNVPVSRGMTHDGLGTYLKDFIQKAPGPTEGISARLILKYSLLAAAIFILSGALTSAIIYFYLSKDLPKISSLTEYHPSE